MNPVVIDTNCLLQIIARKSPYRPTWDAFLAGADYLVSEDSHFRVLHDTPFPQLNLVTLDEFLATRLVQEQ